jgi:hypothetical protein
MNKVIGAGLAAPIDIDALAALEAALAPANEPVRVELATLAVPETGASLTARGYRLIGFENVLACRLPAALPAVAPAVRIERVHEATVADWRDTLVDGFVASDDTGVPVDQLSRDATVTVIDDILASRDFDRYLAYCDGALAGAASMRIDDGVALLTGSATLPGQRRRGTQAALIGARLADAAARGADLAVITTAPGSQSQANVMKRGFALLYARAILTNLR